MKATLKSGLIVACILTLAPLITHAQPPQPAGELVFSDDFSDPQKSQLDENLQATDYSRGFHAPGVYHIIPLSANDTRWSLFPNQTFGDFTVDLEMRDNSDDFIGDASGGIVFRAQDQTHLYAVLLNARKGQYTARKLDGEDQWTDLIAWKDSPLVKRQDEVNHLRVDAVGDQITIYLNDELLDSFSDAAYARGQYGLIAANVDATRPHLHFDNIKVFSSEAPAQQAQTEQAPAQPAVPALPSTGEKSSLEWLLLAAALACLSLGASIRKRAC